jgi:hypothetical protein
LRLPAACGAPVGQVDDLEPLAEGADQVTRQFTGRFAVRLSSTAAAGFPPADRHPVALD